MSDLVLFLAKTKRLSSSKEVEIWSVWQTPVSARRAMASRKFQEHSMD